MRLCLALAVLAGLGASVASLAIVAPAEGGGVRREVVIRGEAFPPSVVILVDSSGSMAVGDLYALAVREALGVAEQASDAGRVRFGAFGDALEWEPQGWVRLPDAEALALARGWLTHHGAGRGTDLAGAVAAALEIEEPELGVVIVTDGYPDLGPDGAAARVEARNAARAGGPATIGVVVVRPNADGDRFGRALARIGRGAYVRVR